VTPGVRAGETSRADRTKASEEHASRVLWIPAAGGDVRPVELAAGLRLNFVTGFFGMNFGRLAAAEDTLFLFALAAVLVLPAGMLWLIRRRQIE
jgi:hypothetical protein